MPDLDRISVKLTADIAEFQRGMKAAEGGVDSFARKGREAEQSLTGVNRGTTAAASSTQSLTQRTRESYGISEQVTRQQALQIRGYENQIAAVRLTAREHAQFIALRRAGTAADSEAGQVMARLAGQAHDANVKVATGTQGIARSAGLARHEMVNLSRQVQDIGVSLASGQSPFSVLVQQGTQVADIFATSTGSVRGFFTQAIGWAARFAVSTTGVATAAATIGAAAVYAATSWSSGQRDIERALTGIGRASGLTRDQINGIGEASSSAFGLSISEAREAATAFAGTGRIYQENTRIATGSLHGLARAMGVDVPEAQKMLTSALLDPAAGALELNKQLGFLDATTLNYIRTLQSSGRLQEAQRALLDALAPKIGEMSASVNLLTLGWNRWTNAVSNTIENLKQFSAQNAERLTGLNFGGFADEERLARARERLSSLQASPFQGPLAQPGLKQAAEEVARLEENMRRLAQATEAQRFAQFSLDAEAVTRAIIPQIAQVEKLEAALAALERMQNARANQGLAADPQADAAAASIRVQIALLMEAQQAEANRAQFVSELAVQYNNVGTSTAVVLATQRAQLAVASAQTVQQRLVAQEQLNIITLRAQDKTLTEATAIAVGQTAIAQAQLRVGLEERLRALREEYELIVASSDEERNRIRAAQTYQRIVDETGDSESARLIAQQQFVNAQERSRRAAEETSEASDRVARSSRNNAAAAAAAADAYERWAAEMRAIQEAQKFVPLASNNLSGLFSSQTWTTQGGQLTQFNPAGYTSTLQSLQPFGLPVDAFNVGPSGSVINQQGIDQLLNQALEKGGGITAALDRLRTLPTTDKGPFTIGGTFGVDPGMLGQNVQKLIGMLAESDPARAQVEIERELARLRQEPVTLANLDQIKTLNDQLEQLTQSTEKLDGSIKSILSPLYSGGEQTVSLGYGYEPITLVAGGGEQNFNYGTGTAPTVTAPTMTQQVPATDPMTRTVPVPTGLTTAEDWVRTRGYSFAEGFEGRIGGSGGRDSQPMMFMGTPGEFVKVTPEKSAEPSSQRVTVNISALNLDSSRRKMATAGRRAARRLRKIGER